MLKLIGLIHMVVPLVGMIVEDLTLAREIDAIGNKRNQVLEQVTRLYSRVVYIIVLILILSIVVPQEIA